MLFFMKSLQQAVVQPYVKMRMICYLQSSEISSLSIEKLNTEYLIKQHSKTFIGNTFFRYQNFYKDPTLNHISIIDMHSINWMMPWFWKRKRSMILITTGNKKEISKLCAEKFRFGDM